MSDLKPKQNKQQQQQLQHKCKQKSRIIKIKERIEMMAKDYNLPVPLERGCTTRLERGFIIVETNFNNKKV